MRNYLDHIGNWPAGVHEAIANKEILVISGREALSLVHGSENRNKMSLFLSNDMVHVGILSLTKGKFSDVEVHAGDEALWVLCGSIQIITWQSENRETSVFQECHSLTVNDKFLIPENYRHQYFNLTDGTAKVLIAVSPRI
jgi:hypothetical protein